MKRTILPFVLICIGLIAAIPKESGVKSGQNAAITEYKAFDANNLLMYVGNNGRFADREEHDGFLLKPSGPVLALTSGLILGAEIDDSIRVMVNQFESDALAGMIDENGRPLGKDDPTFRIYKINRGDTEADNPDYRDWPAWQGAPVKADGTPSIIGDQMLYCTFTDAYPLPIGHTLGHTDPLGAEIHMKTFGLEILDDIVFIEWDIINKSDNHWHNAYIGIFADCELVDPANDQVGSDSLLNLVFAYNGAYSAMESIIGEEHRSMGYALVQAAVVPSAGDTVCYKQNIKTGFRSCGIFSPPVYKHGPRQWQEFVPNRLPDVDLATAAYRRLQGLDYDGNPLINPITGKQSRWAFSGDPYTQSGWLEQTLPQDRRFMLSCGPFDAAPGDTQIVAIAAITATGDHRFEEIVRLKETCDLAHLVYHSTGVVHSAPMAVDPLDRTFSLPVRLSNLFPLQTVSFSLRLETEGMAFTGVTPAIKEQDAMIDFQHLGDNSYRIDIDFAAPCLPGSNTLLYLNGTIEEDKAAGRVGITSAATLASDPENRNVIARSRFSDLIINHKPTPPQLDTPADGVILKKPETTFTWSAAADADNDPLVYRFYWQGQQEPFYESEKTRFPFDGSHFLQPDSLYRYRVSAFDGIFETFSDLGTLSLADFSLWNASFAVNSIPIPEDQHSIDRIFATDKHVFVQTGSMYGSYLYYYDRSDPSLPVYLDKVDFDSLRVTAMTAMGDYFYCSLYGRQDEEWISRIDIYHVDGREASKVNEIELTRECTRLGVSGGLLYAYQCNDKLLLYSLKSLSEPSLLKAYQYEESVNSRLMFVYPYIVYARKSPTGTIQTTKVVIEEIDDQGEKATVVVHPFANVYLVANGGYVFLIKTRPQGGLYGKSMVELYALDLHHPQQPPGLVKTLYMPWLSYSLQENVLTIIDKQLTFYDVTDPYDPKIQAVLRNVTGPLFIKDGWVYAKKDDHTFGIYYLNRIEDPALAEQSAASRLFQNYPNPFNRSTQLFYRLATSARMKIEIYNALGQYITTLVDGQRVAGHYIEVWNGKTKEGAFCAAGIYFARLTVGDQILHKKMVLLP
ncbi:T9SS type A sorting domain-containing protein [candidate division KSB1 bacterium]|nr:T9SS type A sorting domain-containing protein [candidate division KSB1 bacterium]